MHVSGDHQVLVWIIYLLSTNEVSLSFYSE